MIREVCTRNRQQTVIKSSEHEECSVLDARLTTASTSNCNDTTTTTHVWINCHVGFTCGDACTTHGSVRAALAVGRCSGSMVSSNATNSYASPAHTHTHTDRQRERETTRGATRIRLWRTRRASNTLQTSEVDELERSAMTHVWTGHGACALSELPLHTPGIRVLRRVDEIGRFDVAMNLQTKRYKQES